MAEKEIDLTSLRIEPLSKSLLKKAFIEIDSDFQNLINWYRTFSLHSQEERKSKTYLAIYKDEKIGNITISTGLRYKIEDVSNTTKYDHQILLIGKLYISSKYRSQSIGKILLNFVVDIAHRTDNMIGCAGILVHSNNNKRTIKFYRDFGFKEIDNEEIDGERTRTMFFKLPTP